MVLFEIVEGAGYLNTNTAADGYVVIANAPQKSTYYNFLFIQNFGTACDVEILFDSGNNRTNAAAAGKLYRIGVNGGGMLLEVEDGKRFKQIVLHNASLTTALTSGTVTIQYAHKKRIG